MPVLLSSPHLCLPRLLCMGVGWGAAACRPGWPSLICRLHILLAWFWRSDCTGFQKGSASLDRIPYFTCRKVKPISFQAYKRLMLPHRPKCPDLPDSCDAGFITWNLVTARASRGHLEGFSFRKYEGDCLCYRGGVTESYCP